MSNTTTSSRTLNRPDLAHAVSRRLGGTTHSDAERVSRVIDTFFNEVAHELASGNRVKLSGYLTIETLRRSPRSGRNPRTGESVKVKAKRVARFKAGTRLIAAVESKELPASKPYEVVPPVKSSARKLPVASRRASAAAAAKAAQAKRTASARKKSAMTDSANLPQPPAKKTDPGKKASPHKRATPMTAASSSPSPTKKVPTAKAAPKRAVRTKADFAGR